MLFTAAASPPGPLCVSLHSFYPQCSKAFQVLLQRSRTTFFLAKYVDTNKSSCLWFPVFHTVLRTKVDEKLAQCEEKAGG